MSRRVLFIDEDQERSGSTVSLEYLVREFRSAGYEVFVLTWKVEEETRALLAESATLLEGRIGPITTITMCVHFTYTDSAFSVKGIARAIKDVIKFFVGVVLVIKAIRKVGPDVVYANEYSVVQASFAARLMRIRAASHIRSLMLKERFAFRRALISRLVLGCNDHVFAITSREADQFAPSLREREKISVVGEFVSMSDKELPDARSLKETFGMPPFGRIVTMLGGIQHIKGTLDFLNAAQSIEAAFPEVTFVIAGKNYTNEDAIAGEYYRKCMIVAEPLRQKGRLHMLGRISNPLSLVAITDVLVSPSSESHFARPIVEAWSYSKPIVAAATDHSIDLVEDGVDGLLYPVGDWERCGQAMARFLRDSQFCRSAGEAGKVKAQGRFDARTNARFIVDACSASGRADRSSHRAGDPS